MARVHHAASVHDDAEIDAVVDALHDPHGLWVGRRVNAIHPGAGFVRSQMQEYLDGHGVETRTVWTGNVARQPMMRSLTLRVPSGGLPNADAIMDRAFVLPCNHAIGDADAEYVIEQLTGFLKVGY